MRLAHIAKIGVQVETLVAQHPLPFLLKVLDFPLHQQIGGVNSSVLQQGGKTALLEGIIGLGLGFVGNAPQHVLAQGFHTFESLADALGELIVQLRQLLFLNGQYFHPESHSLAGVLGPGIVLGNGQGKLLVLPLGHSFQINGKAGEGQYVLRLRDVIHAFIVHQLLAGHAAQHVQVKQIAKLDRPARRFPRGRFLPESFQRFINLLVLNLHRLFFQAEAVKVAEVNGRLQRYGGLEGNRLQFQDFHARLYKSLQIFVLERLVQGFGNHKVQGFLH